MPRCCLSRLRRVLAPAMSCSYLVAVVQAQGAKQTVRQNPIPDSDADHMAYSRSSAPGDLLPNFAAEPIRLGCRCGCDTPGPGLSRCVLHTAYLGQRGLCIFVIL
jgi:hypothetical protein